MIVFFVTISNDSKSIYKMVRKQRPPREEPKIPEYVLTPIEEAAKAGDLTKVLELYEVHPNQQEVLYSILHFACDGGQLDVVKYVQSIGGLKKEYSNLYRSASWDGHLHIIQYLREQEVQWGNFQFINTLCYYGHLACIEYVLEQGVAWTEEATSHAVTNGHIAILRFAHERGYLIHPHTMDDAAFYGQLECLQYAHTHNFPMGHNAAERAAEKGHIDCLRYCIENNLGWSNEPDNHQNDLVIIQCMVFDQLTSLQVCYEHTEPKTFHLNIALKVQNYDFATYLFKLLQSKNLLDTDYMIQNLNAITQIGSYMYRGYFVPVDVPFDEIKDDMMLRTLCYHISDAYHATSEEDKANMATHKHATLASLLDLILEWREQYRQEQDARYKMVSLEIKDYILQDVVKYCIYDYV